MLKAKSNYDTNERNIVKCSRKFTLIELLVVTVIIAILVAMLLPALARAKYQAKNVICIQNQGQIAIGILSYTSDNDALYPNNVKNSTYNYAPTLISKAAGPNTEEFDMRPMVLPYFGNTLKPNWACPLAPQELFANGGLSWRNQKAIPKDIDTDPGSIVTSYSHFYGRASDTNPNDNGGNSDGYWGSGSAFFRITKGMRKVGGIQRFQTTGNRNDDMEFELLTSDVAWYWWGLVYNHEFYGARLKMLKFMGWQTGDARTNPIEPYDINYATSDGAVHSLHKLRFNDTRVTLSTRTNYHGFILPLDE